MLKYFGKRASSEELFDISPNLRVHVEKNENKYVTKHFIKSHNQKEKCHICNKALTSEIDEIQIELVKTRKCHHIFHRSCLKQSLSRNVKCPICKTIIVEGFGVFDDLFNDLDNVDEDFGSKNKNSVYKPLENIKSNTEYQCTQDF